MLHIQLENIIDFYAITSNKELLNYVKNRKNAVNTRKDGDSVFLIFIFLLIELCFPILIAICVKVHQNLFYRYFFSCQVFRQFIPTEISDTSVFDIRFHCRKGFVFLRLVFRYALRSFLWRQNAALHTVPYHKVTPVGKHRLRDALYFDCPFQYFIIHNRRLTRPIIIGGIRKSVRLNPLSRAFRYSPAAFAGRGW